MANSKVPPHPELVKPKPTAKVEKPAPTNEPTTYRPKQTQAGGAISWSRLLQVFIVPVVAVAIFLAILFFLVLRGVNDAFDLLA
ncbi:hypothetical protein KC640_01865, partial [Candidatus Dojkabacteria bacterium]|nr:hypothetical protein [Candidatus Dojkabacteria bacterium]